MFVLLCVYCRVLATGQVATCATEWQSTWSPPKADKTEYLFQRAHTQTHRDFRKGHTCTVYIFVCMLRSYLLHVLALICRSSGQMSNHENSMMICKKNTCQYHFESYRWLEGSQFSSKTHNLLQNLAASTEGNAMMSQIRISDVSTSGLFTRSKATACRPTMDITKPMVQLAPEVKFASGVFMKKAGMSGTSGTSGTSNDSELCRAKAVPRSAMMASTAASTGTRAKHITLSPTASGIPGEGQLLSMLNWNCKMYPAAACGMKLAMRSRTFLLKKNRSMWNI